MEPDLENFRLSKSAIITYLNCPYNFQLTYVKKKPQLKPEPDSPLQIGTDVHGLFEQFYKDERAKNIQPPYDEAIREIMMEHKGAEKYSNFIENFINFNLRMIEDNGIENYLPIEVESKLYDPELNFVGIIDCVYDTPDGVVILDFKTGKPKPITENRLELLLYKVLYLKTKKVEAKYGGIYYPRTDTFRMARFLKPGEEAGEKETVLTIDDEFEALASLDEVRERISKKHFPPKPGFLCNFCSYGKNGTNICKLEGI